MADHIHWLRSWAAEFNARAEQIPEEDRALLHEQAARCTACADFIGDLAEALVHYESAADPAERLANRMGATFVPEPQAPKYSAKWISQQIGQRSWLPLRDCSICGTDIGYVVNGDHVWFRSACDCAWSDDRRSSFGEIAEMLAMQYADEHRDELMARMLGK